MTGAMLVAVMLAAAPTPTPKPLPIRGVTVDVQPVQRAPGLAVPPPPASRVERPFGPRPTPSPAR